MSKRGGLGCGGAFILILGIAVLLNYWYIFLSIAVLGGAIWYYYHQKAVQDAQAQADADRQQAETERKEAQAGSQVDQIRRFKELLDEGAITQAEFDQQKAKILGSDDTLKF